MNFASAQKLTAVIESKNKRHILLTLLLSALVMQLLSFSAIRWLQKSTLKSLLESQNTAIAYQEWRTVRNGIFSGWIWHSKIKTLCLFHDDHEVLGETNCPRDRLKDQILGIAVSQSLDGTQVRVSLQTSQWLMASGLTMLAILPLTLFGLILRRPIRRKSQEQLLKFLSRSRNSSLNETEDKLSEFEQAIRAETEELVRLRNEAALTSAARQLAHDIRSPLSALNMVLGSMRDEVPEKKRLVIRSAAQRINDIANNLLSGRANGDVQNVRQTATAMLSPLVDSVISEKRTQYRNLQQTEIQIDLSQGYGLFVKLNSVELSRVISNLVNNTVEAFKGNPGKVSVSVQRDGKSAIVTVEDNAGGIPAEVMNRLGERGTTFGKPDGSGLGLYHAHKAMAEMGGRLIIESKLGVGTKVKMVWPAVEAPAWFTQELKVGKRQIVSVDDDETIHLVWAERLKSIRTNNDAKEPLTFLSPEQFLNWFDENQASMKDALFLVDYEFLNHAKKGLDFIEQLGIANSSVLVTSRFDEPSVCERAEKLGVKILPKNLAQYVPLAVE